MRVVRDFGVSTLLFFAERFRHHPGGPINNHTK
jgi:hypothetical protein